MTDKYCKLTEYILKWNEKINVTAIKDPEAFRVKQIEDSLVVCELPEYKEAKRVLDLGTGGGIPGLPLAIASPEKKFVLMDAVNKKLLVVADVAEKLELSNVAVIHGRAEDLGREKEYRESFDLVVSKAVANLSTLSEYCLPFVSVGGYFIAYKTSDAKAEIDAAANAIKLLGGKLLRVEETNNPEDRHLLLVIQKTSKTPDKYPRKAGDPSRKPL